MTARRTRSEASAPRARPTANRLAAAMPAVASRKNRRRVVDPMESSSSIFGCANQNVCFTTTAREFKMYLARRKDARCCAKDVVGKHAVLTGFCVDAQNSALGFGHLRARQRMFDCWMLDGSAKVLVSTEFFLGAQNSSPGFCASVGGASWGVSGNRWFRIGRVNGGLWSQRTGSPDLARGPSSVVSCNGPRSAGRSLGGAVDEFVHRYTICSQGSRMDWICNERFSASGEVEARRRPEVMNDRNW